MRVNTDKDFSALLVDGTHILRQLESGKNKIQMVCQLYYTWLKWVSQHLAVTEMYQIQLDYFSYVPKAAPL